MGVPQNLFGWSGKSPPPPPPPQGKHISTPHGISAVRLRAWPVLCLVLRNSSYWEYVEELTCVKHAILSKCGLRVAKCGLRLAKRRNRTQFRLQVESPYSGCSTAASDPPPLQPPPQMIKINNSRPQYSTGHRLYDMVPNQHLVASAPRYMSVGFRGQIVVCMGISIYGCVPPQHTAAHPKPPPTTPINSCGVAGWGLPNVADHDLGILRRKVVCCLL